MSIPEDVVEVFQEFRTAEMTTISRRGEPITWPVYTRFYAETVSFLVTTSIGLPTKALNIRREPRVGLLFSDPTASGLTTPPAVMVQGLASCGDEVVSVEGLEDYWKTLWSRQPISKLYGLPVVRRFSDYYYMRLVMTIEADRIIWWPAGDFGSTPNTTQLAR